MPEHDNGTGSGSETNPVSKADTFGTEVKLGGMAHQIFDEGTIYAAYNIETKQCISLMVMNFGLSDEMAICQSDIILPSPGEGEAWCEIKNVCTSTPAASENYVDPDTQTLYRKTKVNLYLSEDKDVVGQTVLAREEPYTVNIELVDWQGNVVDDGIEHRMKVKDRDLLAAIECKELDYPAQKSFRVKYRVRGDISCIRVKDNKYKLVPGLLNLKVRPPEF